jgi:hypothetical protein
MSNAKKQADVAQNVVKTPVAPMCKMEQQILASLAEMPDRYKGTPVRVEEKTGYTGVYYGNRVLCEVHIKKKAVWHLTFGQHFKVFKTLKAKRLITRIVPKSYNWPVDVECLLTKELADNFLSLIDECVAEKVEQSNLKQEATKKPAKAKKSA